MDAYTHQKVQDEIMAALTLAIDCIKDAAKEGTPSGLVYAALTEHGMTLSIYQQILDAMVSNGTVTVRNDCIYTA